MDSLSWFTTGILVIYHHLSKWMWGWSTTLTANIGTTIFSKLDCFSENNQTGGICPWCLIHPLRLWQNHRQCGQRWMGMCCLRKNAASCQLIRIERITSLDLGTFVLQWLCQSIPLHQNLGSTHHFSSGQWWQILSAGRAHKVSLSPSHCCQWRSMAVPLSDQLGMVLSS